MHVFLATAAFLVTGIIFVFETGSHYVVLAGLEPTEICLILPVGIKSIYHHALRTLCVISCGTNEFCSMKCVLRHNAKKVSMHDIQYRAIYNS